MCYSKKKIHNFTRYNTGRTHILGVQNVECCSAYIAN